MTIRDTIEEAFRIARSKGWYRTETVPELLALIHSEVSEAMECYRTDYRTDIPNEGTSRRWFDGPPSVRTKPEGFASEMADVVLRVFGLCAYLGIDLEEAIRRKLVYNASRAHRHGNKIA